MDIFELNGVQIGCPEALGTRAITRKLSSGQYEGTEARAVMMRVKPGWRVLELGAGLGYMGALAAQLTDALNVTCVEANPDMLQVIRENYVRNDAAEIDLRHGAVVGDDYEGDTLAFARNPLFWSSRIAEPGDGDGVVEVPALKIGALLKELRPNAVIMDVEGAEQYLFENKWPKSVRVVVMELHPRYFDSRATIKKIIDCMSASGLTYDPQASRGNVLALRRV
ncbi:FkbM family methyltransferase [Lentibacter algarum]|uniref:FkbM family methyltransferase n=1 Tax=Lentibacter algarum TaxID=576131 RepID=UPI001C088977|nr:FkbM family methyltransferase [Lentibacter algarum]MBU2983385.1 FkbM family methyltransferase [Lentibacter algarum]